MTGSTTMTGGSALRSLAWLAGALATSAAVVIGSVLAVVFAATVVVIGFMGSALFGLVALALRARRTVQAKTSSDPTLIEARNVGGHSWVAYGWNERP
ncbi:hypothetical protein ACN2C7_14520 [Caulobacter sp. ErkDOM-E]|jgi:hypothetical protein|uniref:hypothetical protein n=1 Tax=Caulobacter sp. ErkDOM-E TaxID=3402778 RepID=UPI003AF884C7